MNKPFILASKSPRRKQLLEMAEINFKIITADTEENFPTSMSLKEVPVYIANKKAQAIFNQYPTQTIIAADTVVVLHNKIIGKPNDKNDAITILQSLSNQTHEVITGVVVMNSQQTISFASTTEVTFSNLTLAQIEYYVEKYKPYDKAGAYAIQEWIGAVGIKKINGCFYNVMGLPINELMEHIKHLKTA